MKPVNQRQSTSPADKSKSDKAFSIFQAKHVLLQVLECSDSYTEVSQMSQAKLQPFIDTQTSSQLSQTIARAVSPSNLKLEPVKVVEQPFKKVEPRVNLSTSPDRGEQSPTRQALQMSRERRQRKFATEADDRLVEAMKESLARVIEVTHDKSAFSPVIRLDLSKVQEQA